MSLEAPGNDDSEYFFKIFLSHLWTEQHCKMSDQFIKSLYDEINGSSSDMLLMSQRNVGTYGSQPVGIIKLQGQWGLGLKDLKRQRLHVFFTERHYSKKLHRKVSDQQLETRRWPPADQHAWVIPIRTVPVSPRAGLIDGSRSSLYFDSVWY